MNGKTVLAALLVLGGAAVAVAGAGPQSTLTPAEALEAGPGEASVKGMVDSVDGANRSFTLTDGLATVEVQMARDLPAAVEEDKGIVAEGRLVERDGRVVLQADEVLVGCPSKYEA